MCVPYRTAIRLEKFWCNFDIWLHEAAMFHKTGAINDDGIMKYISNASFQI